jgi:hypothetical protein
MRRCVVLSAILAASALATQAGPVDVAGTRGELPLVQVADVDSQHRLRSGAHAHWRYRAAYTRWLHNEYVRAGYPVRHPSRRIYSRW